MRILPVRQLKRDDEGDTVFEQPTPTGSFVYFPDTNDQLHQVTGEPEIVIKRDMGPDGDIVIAVMGPTGSGKSTFVCIASGRDNKAIGHKFRSFKGEVSTVRFWDQESWRHIVLVDTPGFDDTYKSDLEILNLIAGWLVTSYNHRKLLSGILYLHRITDNRVSGLSLGSPQVFRKLCGRDALDKIYLTTTMWDEVGLRVGERRLDELKTGYWKAMIDQGARVACCRSDDESSKKLVRKIILSELGGISPFQSPLVEPHQGPSSHLPEKTRRHDVPRGGTLAPEILYEQGGPLLRQPPLIETRHGPSHLQEKPRRYDVPRAGTFVPKVATPQNADDVWADALKRLNVNGEPHGKPLFIQEEMVEFKKELNETAAGRRLYHQLETLVEKQLMLLRRIEIEKKEASSDREMVREFQREYDDLRVQMDDRLRQMQQLKLPRLKRLFSLRQGLKEKTPRYDVPGGGTLAPVVPTPITNYPPVPFQIPSEQGGTLPRQPPIVKIQQEPSLLQEKTQRHVPQGETLAPEIIYKQGRTSLLQPPLVETQQASSHLQEKLQRHDIPPDLTPYIVKIDDQHLAGGSFGDVYKCQYNDGSKQHEVAVKALRLKYTLDNDTEHKSVRMLRRELGIWKRLDHNNIVPFLGVAYRFGMSGTMSLVSLWMPNETLHNFLSAYDNKLDSAHRLQILHDVSNGLRYLHSFPIVHGDLNSNNVLLDADYSARLADFGYASLVGNIPEALHYLQRSTSRPGALRWIAPEQIDLEVTYDRTTKSDIYSLGCVALQVFSGKQPWSEVREDASVVLRLHLGHKPSRPESRTMDDLHWDLIERCWLPLQDRPTVDDVVCSIQQLLSDCPPSKPLRDLFITSSNQTQDPLSDDSPTSLIHSPVIEDSKTNDAP